MAPFPGRLRAWLRPSPEFCLGGEDCLSEALILSNAKELSINNRPPGKADSFLRQAQDRREILRFAQDKLGMTTERHRIGPRPGAHGFGSFCRNKRTSSRGAETPQEPLPLQSSPDLIGDPVSLVFGLRTRAVS